MNTPREFHIVAYGAQGEGVSGGDRIFIELARRLSKYVEVHLWISEEGKRMCSRMKLPDSDIIYHVSNLTSARQLGSIFYNLTLVWGAMMIGVFKNPGKESVIYSASEFWMDSLPTFFWKLKDRRLIWVASWYQTAPSPLKGFSLTSASRSRLSAVPYWFFQQTTKPYISHFCDFLNVNNNGEKKEFPLLSKRKRIFVMYGAVDTALTRKFEKKLGKQTKKYEAVFQGRFHPQKGVEELIDIWRAVVETRPNAQLVMIGDGPLYKKIQQKIFDSRLSKNIKLLGYVFDGNLKYKTFMQSKVVVHPAYFDSGGMASAEAMAFGLPGVCFDLPAYSDYYPKGMVKVRIDDKKAFARAILSLLQNKSLYNKVSKEAQEMVFASWSWDKRVSDFWKFVMRT